MEGALKGSTRTNTSQFTYIYFHILVQAIIHDETMSEPDSMRLHWMASGIGIVSNVRVIEVGNTLLVAASMNNRI